jgi:hypothetical protein
MTVGERIRLDRPSAPAERPIKNRGETPPVTVTLPRSDQPSEENVRAARPRIRPREAKMGEFMWGEGRGTLKIGDRVTSEGVIRSGVTAGGSMLSDDEVLELALSVGILRFGGKHRCVAQTELISRELQKAARSGKSRSQRAYDVCCRALEMYSQECGFGKLFYVVNSRLRKVRAERLTCTCFR